MHMQVTFLYKLAEGACPRSYGVNVARLAGLPESVLQRASNFSADMEKQRMHRLSRPGLAVPDPCPTMRALEAGQASGSNPPNAPLQLAPAEPGSRPEQMSGDQSRPQAPPSSQARAIFKQVAQLMIGYQQPQAHRENVQHYAALREVQHQAGRHLC